MIDSTPDVNGHSSLLQSNVVHARNCVVVLLLFNVLFCFRFVIVVVVFVVFFSSCTSRTLKRRCMSLIVNEHL